MNLRERNAPDPNRPSDPGPGPDDEALAALQAQSQAFLAAGSAVLKNALSTNSEDYVASNRQQGGE